MKSILVLSMLFSAKIIAEETKKDDLSINLFGSRPIQISISKDGIGEQKDPGYHCELDASLGGGHYSEWGQTEDDARSLVYNRCSGKSGMLLCKKERMFLNH